MDLITHAVRAEAAIEKARELHRCQTDLWYLATKYLNYGWNRQGKAGPEHEKGLTEDLHRPICRWMDENREWPFLALVLPRGRHKTTLLICHMIQTILRNPFAALLYAHAVEELAADVIEEVGKHFQWNDALRSLDPIATDPTTGKPYRCFPTKQHKRFLSAFEFTLRRPVDFAGGAIIQRMPTLRGVGVGTEIRGAHGNVGYEDDICTLRKMDELGGPENIVAWHRRTFLHCIDDKRLRNAFTRVDDRAIYEEWLTSPQWIWWARSATEVAPLGPGELPTIENVDLSCDGVIHHGPPSGKEGARKRLQHEIEAAGEDAWPELFNITASPKARPWQRESCEHDIDPKDLRQGVVVIISDPAPKGVGGEATDRYAARREGDFWAWAAIHLEPSGQTSRAILLDGDFSREWAHDEGIDAVMLAMRRFGTPFFAFEEKGETVGLYSGSLVDRCKNAGTPFYSDVDSKGRNVGLRLQSTLQKGGKKARIGKLAGLARTGQFLISKACSDRFRDAFLAQVRQFPQTPYDDCADAVAYLIDPAFDKIRPVAMPQAEQDADAYLDEDVVYSRSRYCGV